MAAAFLFGVMRPKERLCLDETVRYSSITGNCLADNWESKALFTPKQTQALSIPDAFAIST